MSNGFDRLERLLADDQTAVTGIDFVYVHGDQTTLDVYFHKPPDAVGPSLVDDLAAAAIRIVPISGDAPEVKVSGEPSWEGPDSHRFLRLTTEHPGGFSLYRLYIDDPRIDRFFNGVVFSFKAVCESDLDCKPGPHECPPEEEEDFPVDYQARDFWSLRRALLDFAAQRYPDWRDRLEADAGVMLVEVMSALGDELAYYQDRIGREAYLETATQRRSLRRHARLVDHEIHDGLAASTWLDVMVREPDGTGLHVHALPAGSDVWAESDAGSRVDYEVGRGLADVTGEAAFTMDYFLNGLVPHIWDEDDTCLAVGATELFVDGDHADAILPEGSEQGKWMLLRTDPECADVQARRWLIRVIHVEALTDPLVDEGEPGREITRLVWEEAQALPFELDLTVLEVRGNLVPATAGSTRTSHFVIGTHPDDPGLGLPEEAQRTLTRAVERQGRLVEGLQLEECTVYLFSLPGSEETPLCRLGDDPHHATPEIRLRPVRWDGEWVPVDLESGDWQWRASLLGTFASQPNDSHFALEDGTWRRVVGYQRVGGEIVHRDYASGEGTTVRFGDGEFGMAPRQGTIFEIVYRLGNGRRGNVAAASLVHFDPAALPFVEAITNPLPAVNGTDPETPQEVRRLAPDAFREITHRAVRPEDYGEAAERLSWVQRANGVFRWTGSWVTAFVTPDPLGATAVMEKQRRELTEQIDRFRQAGRDAHIAEPQYADLDLEITICVEPFAYCGEVKERVLEVLLGKSGRPGFFSPDNFTFGTPLPRSRLEAAIQGVPGVKMVEGIQYRRRGVFDWRPLTGHHYPVGAWEVIRVDNDPNHPGHGSVKLEMRGGA